MTVWQFTSLKKKKIIPISSLLQMAKQLQNTITQVFMRARNICFYFESTKITKFFIEVNKIIFISLV